MSGQIDGITETDLRDYLASSSGEESDGNTYFYFSLLTFSVFQWTVMKIKFFHSNSWECVHSNQWENKIDVLKCAFHEHIELYCSCNLTFQV